MIYRIMQNWRNVVTPIIDSIDPDTMEYKAGGLDILAFDWTLKQAFPKRKMDDTEPTESPGMVSLRTRSQRPWSPVSTCFPPVSHMLRRRVGKCLC